VNLAPLLHQIAELLDELPTTAAGLTGTRRTGTIARVGHSDIRVHAVDMAVGARVVLAGWAQVVLEDDEDIHLPPGDDPIDTATLARWMADHHDAFAAHEAHQVIDDELRELRAALRRCIDPGTGRGPVRPEKAAERAGHDGLGAWVPLGSAEAAGRLLATMHGVDPDAVPSESTIRRRVKDGAVMAQEIDEVVHVMVWSVLELARDTPEIDTMPREASA
jgi:hypothetical protein